MAAASSYDIKRFRRRPLFASPAALAFRSGPNRDPSPGPGPGPGPGAAFGR